MSRPRCQDADSPRRDAVLDESPWVSAHLYYHGDLDRLLVTAVDPLVTQLADRGLTEQWFFLRYWEGGQHLRLRMLPTQPGRRADLANQLAAHGAQFFDQYPSMDALRQEDYTRLARLLAAGEQRFTYLERLHTNNSIDFIPYRREHDRFGDVSSMRQIERHFSESSELALSLVKVGASADQRATAGYAAVLLSWFCAEPDPGVLTRWAGGLLASWQHQRTTAGLRVDTADFDVRYQRQRLGLVAIARRLAAHSDDLRQPAPRKSRPNGNLARWAASVARLRDSLAAELAECRSTLPDHEWAVGEPTSMRTRILPVLNICAHLFCNRLGIPTTEERYLRYLAGRALAELAEESS